jgi:isopentenyl-diphosphate delta-isomerase
MDDYQQFEQRKQDHIALALQDENQTHEHSGFDSVSLIHDALPDLNFTDLDLTSIRLGRLVSKPFIVASMTAGHVDADSINQRLIAASAEMDWAMGVGSQRRELTDPTATYAWQHLRAAYPEVALYANLGIAQLIHTPLDALMSLTEGLRADALIIHCNALQECIQPEGTPYFKGCWDALEHLIPAFPLPIIIKETGCGFSQNTLARLNALGVAAVEVSGLGGTHWGRIEGQRALPDSPQRAASIAFRGWGHSTVDCVRTAAALEPNFEIWGSGGVRHGLDAAKLFALGANNVAFAQPLLKAAMDSTAAVVAVMQRIEYELKVALFCTGSVGLHELREKLRV